MTGKPFLYHRSTFLFALPSFHDPHFMDAIVSNNRKKKQVRNDPFDTGHF